MLKFKLKLNLESVDEVLQGVTSYEKKVKKSAPELVRNLTEQGVSIAKQNASYMNIYDSGDLVNGIEAEYIGAYGVDTAKGKVHSTARHSAFCEFGTGVVGAGNPHPDPIPGWVYDSNQHGEAGWWYYDKNGNKRWTKGMPSRPFMYDTARMLRGRIIQSAKEVLK